MPLLPCLIMCWSMACKVLLVTSCSFTLYPTNSRVGRVPSVKTLRYALSAELWKYCVLNGGTQRRL